MSTRSRIGVLEADGTVTSIYCHFDGYLRGVGATLLESYSDGRKVRALMRRGCISVLRAKTTACEGYGDPARNHAMNAWTDSMQDFEYLWRGRKWYFRKLWNKRPLWKELTEKRVRP